MSDQIKPRFSKIIQIINVEDGFIVLEDSAPKFQSNLYKLSLDLKLVWNAHLLPSSSEQYTDVYVNPVILDGSWVADDRDELIYLRSLFCRTYEGYRVHISLLTGRIIHAYWRKE